MLCPQLLRQENQVVSAGMCGYDLDESGGSSSSLLRPIRRLQFNNNHAVDKYLNYLRSQIEEPIDDNRLTSLVVESDKVYRTIRSVSLAYSPELT